MQKKMFILLYFALGFIADLVLSFKWSLILSIPLLVLSWWIVYRSGWFDWAA